MTYIDTESLARMWANEITAWEDAAEAAAKGGEHGVASRNRVRAHTIRCCLDDLREAAVHDEVADCPSSCAIDHSLTNAPLFRAVSAHHPLGFCNICGQDWPFDTP